MSKVRVATAQYPVDFLKGWDHYVDKITSWVKEAAGHDAQLAVFPEYASMELVSLFAEEVRQDLPFQMSEMQRLLDDYLALHRELARQYGMYVVGGSFPVRLPDGSYRNRAYVFSPQGRVDYQEKILMTRFESELWLISYGDQLKVFETPFGAFGINICYDSEFPLLARRQVEAGANLIVAPSCTDSAYGYHRVRIGCQARALENQCYVAHAVLVGEASWSIAIDENCGRAAVYTPVDVGFYEDGIASIGEWNAAQWVYADVDLARSEEVRVRGEVLNFRDWDNQSVAASAEIERVHLE
ncbi:amidohydrolase [Lujinxingia litoralis]|uniref:Amidohydrolase n=1 Tax=Lujinxingia litoralis TaxID=2211119 RepID=A0A328C401_9DELT|nr:carbon-nitrogen hydrolase family protein [Lujinxingia litoralis]RAL21774.1 amidohydrolase [Lujinxingia litoralis]